MNITELISFIFSVLLSFLILGWALPRNTKSNLEFLRIANTRMDRNKKETILIHLKEKITIYLIAILASILILISTIFWLIKFSTIWTVLICK